MPETNYDDVGLDVYAALAASGHAFSVCDAGQPDFPLNWVNGAFEQLTGYSAAEVAGHNCRFLKGPDTDPGASGRIRAALEGGWTVTETLLNYRKDGTSWWNRVIITPVRDAAGSVTHFVGVQSNVDAQVHAETERDNALAEVRAAETRQYASEHAQAVALQRSLLPVLPRTAGLELAARYLPASRSAEVGGDWYDVLPLPDGSTGLAIGDVMGHDLRAAASMGQLRSVLRSYAWEGHGTAEVLDRLNQLVCGLGMAQLATCVYARLEPARAGRPAGLRWSNAGHPPPMLRTPDGEVHVLTEAAGVLIGVTLGASASLHQRASARREVPSGSTLLLYTDGLIEDRTHDIDVGIDALRRTFAAADPRSTVDELADEVVSAGARDDQDDDICVLVVRIGGAETPVDVTG